MKVIHYSWSTHCFFTEPKYNQQQRATSFIEIDLTKDTLDSSPELMTVDDEHIMPDSKRQRRESPPPIEGFDFAHVAVVRGKARETLPGHECDQCRKV